MTAVIGFMQRELSWDISKKPIAFNQDGPGWACKNTLKFGFPFCFNSGTVLWQPGVAAGDILGAWWNSAGDAYVTSKFKAKWRTKWPWEQAQMYKIYEKYAGRIQVLSFPNHTYLPWYSTKNPRSQYPTDEVEPWCFSHWPGANCFITHFCSSVNQKKKMTETFRIETNLTDILEILI